MHCTCDDYSTWIDSLFEKLQRQTRAAAAAAQYRIESGGQRGQGPLKSFHPTSDRQQRRQDTRRVCHNKRRKQEAPMATTSKRRKRSQATQLAIASPVWFSAIGWFSARSGRKARRSNHKKYPSMLSDIDMKAQEKQFKIIIACDRMHHATASCHAGYVILPEAYGARTLREPYHHAMERELARTLSYHEATAVAWYHDMIEVTWYVSMLIAA